MCVYKHFTRSMILLMYNPHNIIPFSLKGLLFHFHEYSPLTEADQKTSKDLDIIQFHKTLWVKKKKINHLVANSGDEKVSKKVTRLLSSTITLPKYYEVFISISFEKFFKINNLIF